VYGGHHIGSRMVRKEVKAGCPHERGSGFRGSEADCGSVLNHRAAARPALLPRRWRFLLREIERAKCESIQTLNVMLN